MGVGKNPLSRVLPVLPAGDTLISAVDFVVNWARANSLWPLVYGTSCCAIEMMATGSSKHDWARFGAEVARATPRQADMIILAGTLVEKMGPRLLTLYEQMPSPKYVIAMGACTISGGPFYYDSYSVIKGADRIIPVDVYIPGCPPRPEALLYGIMQLQDLIRKETLRNPRPPAPLNTKAFIDLKTECDKAWKIEDDARQEAMKEAKEKFKLENPDYKAYKHEKVPTEKFEECPRPEPAVLGKSHSELFDFLIGKFPSLRLSVVPDLKEGEEVLTPKELVKKQPADVPLDLVVEKEDYIALINLLKNHEFCKMDFLTQLTAIDWKDRFEVVVQLMSIDYGHYMFIRVAVDHDKPSLESLYNIYPAADWHEREVYDFFGIHFEAHPDLRRLFLEDDFPGHPLRKDFSDPSRIVKRPY